MMTSIGVVTLMLFVYSIITTALYFMEKEDKWKYRSWWRMGVDRDRKKWRSSWFKENFIDTGLDDAMLSSLENEANDCSGDGEVDAFNKQMLKEYRLIRALYFKKGITRKKGTK